MTQSEGQTTKTRSVSFSPPERGEGRDEGNRLTLMGVTIQFANNRVDFDPHFLSHPEMLTRNGFGVRGHDRALELADMSASQKTVPPWRDRRTPNGNAIEVPAEGCHG